MKESECSKTISVKDDVLYSLSIAIGDGHEGDSAFKNYDKKWVVGVVQNVALGTGKTIKQSPLVLVTTVTKNNPATDHASVTYELNGQDVYECQEDFATGAKSMVFTTTLCFK